MPRIDLEDAAISLLSSQMFKGRNPLFVEVLKGDYPYQGNYVCFQDKIGLHFYEIKKNYTYKGKNAVNFTINYSELSGYHWSFYDAGLRLISIYFKDELEFNILYRCDTDDTKFNGKMATLFMENLKKNNVLQRNKIVEGGSYGQKAISKTDQYFTKEIRAPRKKKGLFGFFK